jgi:VWFA-related protein
MRNSLLALVLAFTLLTPTAAQQPAAQAQTPDRAKDDVVRITTNLVQIDAVITNRKGQQITDLAPEDFEIYEDGHPQEIKNFSYITVEQGAAVAAPVKPKSKDKTFVPPPPPPPEQLRPEQVRRSIALVVDDLGLSFETTSYVRNALRKFVDEQMHSGDMVAIIRTGAGVGALQQFTTDKQLLHAAIDRVKWNAFGRRGINAFGSVGEDAFHTEASDPRRGRYTSIDPDAEMKGSVMNSEQREAANRARVNDFKDEIFTVGTLGALNYVVKGLKELPGRKSVVLLTDELDLFSSTSSSNFRVLDALRHLIDLANRSSVVFYTIDPRGIPVLNDSAANSLVGASKGDGQGGIGATGVSGSRLMQDLMSRSLEIAEAENGMNYLARQTGGFLVNNNNDVAGGIRRVLDQKGYYLIGYRPQESTFNAAGKRNYHKLELRVKRPGLTVHTRAGFYGVSSETAVPVNRTRLQQLVSALTSPFASGAVDLRLTSVFLNDPTYGSFVRSLIHVDGKSLTFTDEADGAHKATIDVAAVTFDDGGAVVDQRFRTETMLVRGEQYRSAQRDGITFGINLPIKKPGAFQLRIAVLDVAANRVGSANQFIDIPNLNKNKLTLSGLYLAGNVSRRQNDVTIQPASGVAPTAVGEGDLGEAAAQAGPAVRSFRPGMMLDYGYEAYNVRLDSATSRAKLQIQLRLFKENQQLFSGAPMSLSGPPNAKRVSAIGHLQLGQLAPGDYVLQIIVTDLAEPNKPRVASQWIPFEVE